MAGRVDGGVVRYRVRRIGGALSERDERARLSGSDDGVDAGVAARNECDGVAVRFVVQSAEC